MIWLLCLLTQPTIVDEVDLMERAFVHAEDSGSIRGEYLLFWELKDGTYRIRDWRNASETGLPTNNVVEFWDNKSKIRRRIEARVFIETHKFFDRETEDRKVWPEARRRKLRSR